MVQAPGSTAGGERIDVRTIAAILFLMLVSGSVAAAAAATTPYPETEPLILPLCGPVADPLAEVSGLAWYGDELLILPQLPNRLAKEETPFICCLAKQKILDWIDGRCCRPLRPRHVPCPELRELPERIEGYDGLEAVAIDGDDLYLAVEAWGDEDMLSYLVRGVLQPGLQGASLDLDKIVPIERSLQLPNMSDETLLVAGDRLLTLHEANGANVHGDPRARLFDLELNARGSLPSPTVEYRITDASSLDADGRFWVINYFFPRDQAKLSPAVDRIAEKFGVGATHARSPGVERLIELQYTTDAVVLTDTPPVVLQLAPGGALRNWEGLVRLHDGERERGFLIVSDRFPETLLAFVPLAHAMPDGAERPDTEPEPEPEPER